MNDRYGFDVLSDDPHRRGKPTTADLPVARGLVIEDVESGYVGEVTGLENSGGQILMELTDRWGATRMFPLGPGYWVEGKPVNLLPPVRRSQAAPRRTASGSRAVTHQARTARASRIWVEGRHDAELVEKVWGDDLRYEGVVVEYLEGIDNLAERLGEFEPGPTRRVGVLVDHLVPGSKEARIADDIHRRFPGVLVLGHPYVDVWQAVKPGRIGLAEWPRVPRGIDIKVGTLQALGWPNRDQADIAAAWKRILGRVRDFRDLEPSLLGRVEELVDFVTEPGAE
ncbi:MAG TPA: DUF3097 domain-containing protein [Beutenbergiaceae bacterium]|nr:DUF3097 domain-containing protein [Beutenbergiaceae bacterium]